MNPLTKFELRKIMKRKSTLAAIIIMLIAVLLITLIIFSEESSTDESGKGISGLSAISLNKEQAHNDAGQLTTEKISLVIENYISANKNPANLVASPDSNGMTISDEAYGKYIQKDLAIQNLIRKAFAPENQTFDYYVIDSLSPKDASDFYKKRIDKVNQYLNMDYTYGNYSDNDKTYFEEMNNKIQIPFTIDYTDGWENLLMNLSSVILVIVFAMCVCISPVFASEYQTGADSIILSSRYGRNKVIAAKLKSSIIFTTGLFLSGLLLFTLPILCVWGIYGWNCNLQAIQFISPFPLNLLQTYLLAIMIGYLVCLMVMAITLLLSAKMKSSFSVIICSALLIFCPMFIPYSKSSRLFNHLLNLLPVKAMDGYSAFSHYELYHIFGQPIVAPVVIGIMTILVSAIALPFAYLGFKRHQVA